MKTIIRATARFRSSTNPMLVCGRNYKVLSVARKKNKQEKTTKILSNVKQITGYKPPTLVEILEMKNNLNKV